MKDKNDVMEAKLDITTQELIHIKTMQAQTNIQLQQSIQHIQLLTSMLSKIHPELQTQEIVNSNKRNIELLINVNHSDNNCSKRPKKGNNETNEVHVYKKLNFWKKFQKHFKNI